MKKFPRILFLSFAVTSCLGFLAFPSVTALAQSATGAAADSVIPPTIPPVPGGWTYLGTGYNSDASLNPILNSMNITLNTKLADLGQYLHGNENMGNGLIELLMSINGKVDKNGNIASEGIKTSDALARSRMYVQGEIDDAVARGLSKDGTSMHNEEMSCADATYASGAASSHGGTMYHVSAMQDAFSQQLETDATSASRAGNKLGTHANYCTDTDIKNKVPECISQPVSQMPNADRQLSSLSEGAVAPGKPTNGSLTVDQQKAALAYVTNLIPAPPSLPPSSMKNTPSGRLYEVNRNTYLAMASAAANPMLNTIALHASGGSIGATKGVPYANVNMGSLTSSGFGQNGTGNWSSTQALWGQVFGPNYAWPKAPSEWDVINFEVFSRYANRDWQTQVASFTEQQSLQELVRMTALDQRLRLMEIQRLQENNNLLSTLLAHQLNPVTKASLEAEKSSIQTSSP